MKTIKVSIAQIDVMKDISDKTFVLSSVNTKSVNALIKKEIVQNEDEECILTSFGESILNIYLEKLELEGSDNESI